MPLALGLLLVCCGPLAASEPSRPGGSDPVDPAVDALFADYASPASPGCALGVIRDGEFVYRRGYGMANLEYGIPIGPQSVFRIASTSKQFTAAAVALLADAGKLGLDDPVSRWFPEFPQWAQSMSVRQLVLHTSGIRDYLELAFLAGKSDDADYYDDDWVLELLARQRETNFPPGEQFLYSNSGYLLLAHLVERASGQTLREYAQARIFGPLGMDHSHFHDDHGEIVPRRASGYAPDGDAFRISMTTLDLVGDGGVFTTIDDLLAWDRNFYANRLGGGQQLIEQLTTPGRLNDGELLDYAFGLDIGRYRGLPTVSHGGSFVGFRAELLRFPGQAFTVAVLCNRADALPGDLARRVADHYLEAEFTAESPADTQPPTDAEPGGDAAGGREDGGRPGIRLSDYVGAYYSPELDVSYQLRAEGDRLLFDLPGHRGLQLTPTADETFGNPDYGAFEFLRGPDGRVSGFRLQSGRVRNLAFHRR